MGDTIRMDLHEMDALSRDLRRLSGEIEDIGTELYRVQLRLGGTVQASFEDELILSRKRLMQARERSEAVACRILRASEQFAGCEQAERRRFEEGMGVIPVLKHAVSPGKEPAKRDPHPFTPKNVHSVRMPVQEEDRHI